MDSNRSEVYNELCVLFFFFFFWDGLCDPIACPIVGDGIPSQNSGYKVTRLYPSIMFFFYFVHPPSLPSYRHSRGFNSSSLIVCSPPGSAAAADDAALFSPSQNLNRPVPTIDKTPSPPASERALTEVQNTLRCNILCDRVLPLHDIFPNPLESCSHQCFLQRVLHQTPIPMSNHVLY